MLYHPLLSNNNIDTLNVAISLFYHNAEFKTLLVTVTVIVKHY